jgi:hypothetical protein
MYQDSSNIRVPVAEPPLPGPMQGDAVDRFPDFRINSIGMVSADTTSNSRRTALDAISEDMEGNDAPSTPPRNPQGDFDDIMESINLQSAIREPPGFNAPKPWVNHEETRGFELYLIHSATNELREGDTLVFVDFPDQPVGTKYADCNGIAFKSQQVLVSSKKLLDTGSTRFAEMLSPTYQFRIQRRKKLVNKLPPGVKFVLDLTPPSEGDDLVFQMTELSLTPGILKWWKSRENYYVDQWIVSGHDDVCRCWEYRARQQASVSRAKDKAKEEVAEGPKTASPDERRDIEQAIRESVRSIGLVNDSRHGHIPNMGRAAQLVTKKEKGDFSIDQGPPHLDIPDYCPVRHCANIIRLLMMIEGRSVLLDSAPRIWTLVGIAKILDCPSVVVIPLSPTLAIHD